MISASGWAVAAAVAADSVGKRPCCETEYCEQYAKNEGIDTMFLQDSSPPRLCDEKERKDWVYMKHSIKEVWRA
jgi:hypothetical protein